MGSAGAAAAGGGMAGLSSGIMGLIGQQGRTGADIQEDIFEQYIRPYMEYEQRTFWPIGEELRPIIHERLGERPEDYFRLEERMGREAIGKRTGEGIRLARESATQGRMGGGVQAEMISQIIRGGAESEAELARNLVLARTGEEKARIGEAMAFAGRPSPAPTGLLQMGAGADRGGGGMSYALGQLAGAAGGGFEKYLQQEYMRPYYEKAFGPAEGTVGGAPTSLTMTPGEQRTYGGVYQPYEPKPSWGQRAGEWYGDWGQWLF